MILHENISTGFEWLFALFLRFHFFAAQQGLHSRVGVAPDLADGDEYGSLHSPGVTRARVIGLLIFWCRGTCEPGPAERLTVIWVFSWRTALEKSFCCFSLLALFCFSTFLLFPFLSPLDHWCFLSWVYYYHHDLHYYLSAFASTFLELPSRVFRHSGLIYAHWTFSACVLDHVHFISLLIRFFIVTHFAFVMGGFQNFWSPGMFYWAVSSAFDACFCGAPG